MDSCYLCDVTMDWMWHDQGKGAHVQRGSEKKIGGQFKRRENTFIIVTNIFECAKCIECIPAISCLHRYATRFLLTDLFPPLPLSPDSPHR